MVSVALDCLRQLMDGFVLSLVVIAGEKSWWCSLESVVRPAIDLASVASLASSGSITF